MCGRRVQRSAYPAPCGEALGDDAAVVLTVGGLGKSDGMAYDKLQTFAMVRREGRWMCSAFQNTRMSRRTMRQYNPNGRAGILGSLRGWFERRRA